MGYTEAVLNPTGHLHMYTKLRNRATPPRLSYTLDAFCEATGISRTAAYAAIASGSLSTFKNGKRRYVSTEAANTWIATRERGEARQVNDRAGEAAKFGRRKP